MGTIEKHVISLGIAGVLQGLKATRIKPVPALLLAAWQNVSSGYSLQQGAAQAPLTNHSQPKQPGHMCPLNCLLPHGQCQGTSFPGMQQEETELRRQNDPFGMSTLMTFYTVGELKTSFPIKCLI